MEEQLEFWIRKASVNFIFHLTTQTLKCSIQNEYPFDCNVRYGERERKEMHACVNAKIGKMLVGNIPIQHDNMWLNGVRIIEWV